MSEPICRYCGEPMRLLHQPCKVGPTFCFADASDFLSGLSNSTAPSRAPSFAEMDAALERLCASRYAVRHAVRINLTEADMSGLLSSYGVKPGPNEVGRWPLAQLRGLPTFYGERSEIVFSDGTTEPITASPSPT